MKFQKILLGLFVWLVSVGAAYYIGLNLNSTEPVESKIVIKAPSTTATVEEKSKAEEPRTSPDLVNSIMELSPEDLDEAIRQAASLSESDKRALLTQAFALPEGDYRRSRMIGSLLNQLAETAPQDALALAQEIGSLRDTERARVGILEVWAKNDPAAALAWAKVELANEPLRSLSSQMLAIYRGYAKSNPQAAFAAALAMDASTSGQQRIQSYALEEIIEQQIENGGLLDAKLQVELLEEGETKNRLLSELVDEWASYDPVGAAAYVESLGEDVSSAVKARLVGEWAENDPEAAAAWLSAREVDEETLGQASTAIIRQWTRYDMAASAEWLNSQPSSPALDRAVMSYTYRAAQEDPASAMTWAESIDNDWMRTRMMQHVAGTWKNDDPGTFQSYIDNSELNDEQKKKLQDAEAIHGSRRWWR